MTGKRFQASQLLVSIANKNTDIYLQTHMGLL